MSTNCHSITDLAFPITLNQDGIDRFTVIYGEQVKSGLTYAEAAAEYGRSIMHALACDGRLDNRERRPSTRRGNRTGPL